MKNKNYKTAEEFSKEATDEDVKQFFLFLEDPFMLKCTQEDLEFSCRALGYAREVYFSRYTHTLSDKFRYNRKTGKEIIELVESALLCAIVALYANNEGPLSLHEWCTDDSLVVVLAQRQDGYDEAIVAISFSTEAGDHMELFSPRVTSLVIPDYIINKCAEIAGFPSYEAHDLFKYLAICEYTPYIDEKGYFKPSGDNTTLNPGYALFAADAYGMEILYWM